MSEAQEKTTGQIVLYVPIQFPVKQNSSQLTKSKQGEVLSQSSERKESAKDLGRVPCTQYVSFFPNWIEGEINNIWSASEGAKPNFFNSIFFSSVQTHNLLSSRGELLPPSDSLGGDGNIGKEDPKGIQLHWRDIPLATRSDYRGLGDRSGDRSRHFYLDKILFTAACSYFLIVFFWLVRLENSLNLPFFPKEGVVSNTSGVKDIQFLEYMERSLNLIEQKKEQTKPEERKEEFVYLPVFTPSLSSPTTPAVPLSPTPETHHGNVQTRSISSLPPPPPPPPVAESPVTPTSSAPTNPESATSLATAPPAPTPSAIAPKISATPHTLIGLLELGEQSAALFEVDNVTNRILLGEEIGNTGWIVESIAQQKLKIRRQMEVRSLSIGENL